MSRSSHARQICAPIANGAITRPHAIGFIFAIFAISEQTPAGLTPLEAGLIVADPYGAEVVRETELRRMAPASRRNRLHRLVDPGALDE